MIEHKNKSRAPLRPLDFQTLALTVGGLGFLRPAPGTWGTTPPVIIAALMSWLGQDPAVIIYVMLLLLVLSSMACIVFGVYAEQRFGRKDAAEVVADETAGVCIPLIVVVLAVGHVYWGYLAAFLLFRLLDISKPWPMGWLENRRLGWGVLLDDLMAGVYAAAIILATAAVWPRLLT